MTDWNEGDMADEIVEHMLWSASVTECTQWARKTLERDIKSWSTERVSEVYKDLFGGHSDAL